MQAAKPLGSGESGYSNQRNIVQNDWGYWVFFNNGGTFSWIYSSDGVTWKSWDGANWNSTPQEVMDDTENEGSYGSVWYVASSSKVYVICSPATYPAAKEDPSYLYGRWGTLQSDGKIIWGISTQQTSNLTKNAGKDIMQNPAYPSMCVASDGYVFITLPYLEVGKTNKNRPGVNRGSGNFSSWQSPIELGAADDGAIGGDDAGVVPIDNSGGAYLTYDINAADKGVPVDTALTDGTEDGLTSNPDNKDGYLSVVSAPELDGRIFIAMPDSSGKLYYNERTGGGVNSVEIEALAYPWKNVSISLNGSSYTDDLYVVATDSSNLVRVFKGVWNESNGYHSDWSELASDRWAPRSGTRPNLVYQGSGGYKPLPLVYQSGTDCMFDRIITSTFSAPTITYLEDPQGRTSPASAGQKFSGQIIIYGNGFLSPSYGDIGVSFNDTKITVNQVDWVSQSKVSATITVNWDATAGYRDVQVTNPDAQSSNVLTSSFTVTAPQSQIDNIWPPLIDVGGSKYSKGVSSFTGTSSLNAPPSPAELETTRIKILRNPDPAWFWNGSGFQDPSGVDEDDKYVAAVGSSPWSYTAWNVQLDGINYSLYSRGYSDDGGKGFDSDPETFTVDKEFNSNVINSPSGGTFYTDNIYNPGSVNLTSLSGQGTDYGVGVSTITIRISIDIGMDDDYSNDVFWDWCGSSYSWTSRSTAWQNDPKQWPNVPNSPWSPPGSPKVWTMHGATDPLMPSWENGKKYRVKVWAQDRLGGSKYDEQAEPKFYYDTERPTVTLNVPAAGQEYYSSMDAVSGNCYDNIPPAQVLNEKTVYVKIQDLASGAYWYKDGVWVSTTSALYNSISKYEEDWSLDTSGIGWQDGRTYRVFIYAEDKAGNIHAQDQTAPEDFPQIQREFKYDSTNPDSSITSPDEGDILEYEPTIEGTGYDSVYYSTTTICLKSDTINKFWNQSINEYQTTPIVWNTAVSSTTGLGTHNWEYASSSVTWKDGHTYYLWSRAYDQGGNEQDPPVGYSTWDDAINAEAGCLQFQVDFSTPESQVTFPVDGDSFHSADLSIQIQGTCHTSQGGFPLYGSDVDNYPQLKIKRLSDEQEWESGTGWVGSSWNNTDWVVVGDQWKYDVNDIVWSSGEKYEISVYCYDKAGWNEPSHLEATVVYDDSAPVSGITSPVDDSYIGDLTSISGTAEDYPTETATTWNSGVKQVWVRIKRSSDNRYWDYSGSTWTVSSNTWNVATDTGPWTFTNVPTWNDGLDYTINSRAEDNADNFDVYLDTITVHCDKAPPTSEITNPPHESTVEALNLITGTSNDAGMGVKVSSITIQENFEPNRYYWNWDVNDWTTYYATACWKTATKTGGDDNNWVWEVDTSAVGWQDGQNYKAKARAMDLGGSEAESGWNTFKVVLPCVTFEITWPDSAPTVAGENKQVRVEAVNQFGNTASGYQGRIEFTTDDANYPGTTILPSTYTFTVGIESWKDNGIHTFEATGDTDTVRLTYAPYPTAQTRVSVRDFDNPSKSTDTYVTIANKAVPPGSIQITYPDSVTAGELVDCTALVVDEYGNRVSDYTGTVYFYSDDSKATLPANYTFTTGGGADNGEHTWGVETSTYVVLKTATQTGWKITITDTLVSSITGEKTSIIVNVGPPYTYEVKVDTTPVITAGEGRSVYVRVTDSCGNTVEDYDQTIAFDDDDPLTSSGNGLPINYTFQVSEQGEHIFEGTTSTDTVRLKTKGTRSVEVYQTDIHTREGSHQNIQVDAGAVTQFKVEMSTLCTAGVAEDITIYAKDQYGNTNDLYDTTLTFDCSVAPDGWTPPAPASMTNGYCYKGNYVAIEKAGTGIWVRAEDASYQGQQDNIEVVAATTDHLKVFNYPSSVQAGSTGNYVWVEAQDEYDNKYTLYTGTVTFSVSDPQATPPGDYVFQLSDNGSRPFEVILKTVGSNWNIKAWDKYDTTIDTGTQSGRAVTPDSASQFEVSLATNQTVGVRSTIITVEAKDAYGNRDTNYSSGGSTWTITFYSDDTGATFEPPTYYFLSTNEGYKEFKDSDGYGVTFSTGGTFYVRVEDDQTTPVTGQKDNIFVTLRPESDISFPQDNGEYNNVSPPTIWGTLWDDESVSQVEIKIYQVGGDYWQGDQWSSDEKWLGASEIYSSSWTYTGISDSDFITGVDHKIVSRAIDNRNNYEAEYSTITFLYDKSDPETVILSPANGVNRNTSCNVSGTAVDKPDIKNSDLDTIYIMVKQLDGSTTQYWQYPGPGWQGTPYWKNQDAVSGDWVLSSTPTWATGCQYKVYAYHIDQAGNEESPPILSTFIFDTNNPESFLTRPCNDFHGTDLTAIVGTFVDYPSSPNYNAGVNAVNVRIYCSSGTEQGEYWDGDSWESLSPDDAWQYGFVWASTWTYTSLTNAWNDGDEYIVNSKVRDSAQNWETTITTATFIYDDIGPTCSLTKPKDDDNGTDPYYYEEMNTIEGTASDTAPGEVDHILVCIRNTQSGHADEGKYWHWDSWSWETDIDWINAGAPSGASWSLNTSTVSWSSTETGVKYRVWAKAVDKANNTGAADDNYFYFRSPKPTTDVDIPADGLYYYQVNTAQGSADQHTNTNDVWVKISSGPAFSGCWDNTNKEWKTSEVWNQANWDGSPSNPWTLEISTQCWTNLVEYNIKCIGHGPAGWEEEGTGNYFYIDQTKPEPSVITLPEHSNYYQTISQIEGTSSDTSPGKVDEVQLYIKKGSLYWHTTYWSSGELWLDAEAVDEGFNESSEDWKYVISFSTICWSEETMYTVVCKAKDKVPNTEASPWASNNFYIDVSSPTSQVTTPYDNEISSSVPIIIGDANDPGTYPALDEVYLRIRNDDDSNYYKGPGQGWGAETWLEVTTLYSSSWTYTMNDWTSQRKYILTSKAEDKATNTETNLNSITLIFDQKAPESTVTEPEEGEYYNATTLPTQITGTATDTFTGTKTSAGIENNNGVNVSILKKGTTDYYWSGSAFDSEEEIFDVCNGSYTWTYNMPTLATDGTDDATYVIRCKATDKASNVEVNISSVTFIYDTIKPTFGTVTPASSAKRKDSNVTFTLSEEIKAGTGIIKFTAQTSYNGEVQNSSHTYTLNSSECQNLSEQTLSVSGLKDGNRYKLTILGTDLADNQTDSWENTNIVYDETLPISEITSPNKSYYNSLAIITGTAEDPPPVSGAETSGLLTTDAVNIRIIDISSTTYKYWHGNEWLGSSEWLVTLSTNSWQNWYYDIDVSTAFVHNHQYKVEAKAFDQAGNEQSPVDSYTFTFDTATPSCAVILPVEGRYYNELISLKGTASDPLADIKDVEVQIHDTTADRYWNVTDWGNIGEEHWLTAAYYPATDEWEYTSVPAKDKLTSNNAYTSQCKAFDEGGNQKLSTIINFTGDVDTPTSKVEIPDSEVVLNYYNYEFMCNNDIEGTAFDAHSGVKEVRFYIKRDHGDPNVYYQEDQTWGENVTWLLANGATSWYLHISTVAWDSGGTYHVISRAIDNSWKGATEEANFDTILSTGNFQYDADDPESYVTDPANGACLNTKPLTISGGAEDNPVVNTDVANVKVALKSCGGTYNGKYWAGVMGWLSGIQWRTRDGGSPEDWTRSVEEGAYTTGGEVKYQIFVCAWDGAQNKEPDTEPLEPKCTFYYDITPATSTITYPGDGEYYTTGEVSQIEGEHYDSFTGVEFVEIRISSGTYYWTGSSWTTTNVWASDKATLYVSSWTYTTVPDWTDGADYIVNCRAMDKAQNLEPEISTITFHFDTSPPDSVIDVPVDGDTYENEGVMTMSGTSSDGTGSGVKKTYIAIQQNFSPNYWWNGSTWTSSGSELWLDTGEAANWDYEISYPTFTFENNSWYIVKSKAEDNVNIEETSYDQKSFRYVLPAKSLQITGINSPVTAGAENVVTVTAKNQNGTAALWYQGTVKFSSNDNYASFPGT
ncbi:MAG: hypothetical protein GH147_08960, partial [Clostridia bacterium]|nr:hypothetical protein [Clostridia bacterium]